MADNYLEKKMEEHRRGAAKMTYSKHFARTRARENEVMLKFDQSRVLVAEAMSDATMSIVKRLGAEGFKVAFVSSEAKVGAALAQASGARFYPVKDVEGDKSWVISDILNRWGGIDILILSDDYDLPVNAIDELKRVIKVGESPDVNMPADCNGLIVNAISTRAVSPDDVASFALYLCLRDAEFINGVLFQFAAGDKR